MKQNFLQVEDAILYDVIKDFNRDEKSFDEDVSVVTKWLQEQPHLPEVLDKRVIQNFLLLNKCSVEKTKQKIDMYFTVRSKLEDVFGESNPKLPHLKELREIMYFVIYPKTFKNNRLFIFKMRQEHLGEKLEPMNVLRHLLSIHEIRMKEDVTFGEYFIVDCSHVPVSYVLKLTPTFVFKALAIIYEKLYSSRLKGLCLVNFPKFGEAALTLAQKVMKPKLFERIKVCTDLDSLKDMFPEDVLPAEFGGTGLTLQQLGEMLETKLCEYQSWYDHLDTIQVDEKLRPESLKNDDILGFHGNFKKLDVDHFLTIMFETSADALKTILQLYDQNEESLRLDIAKLKNWMTSQGHLPEILDDKSIENFLILTKFSIERTKQSIDMYYTVRSLIPEFYEHVNPRKPNMAEMRQIAYWLALPKMTDDMHRVMVFKMRNKQMIDKMEPRNVIGLVINLEELRLKEDVMFGDVTIFDNEGINFGYIKKLTPSIVAKVLTVYEKVFSIPMKAIYVVNSPPFVSTILGILKSLMKPKLFERIHVCQDTSILTEKIPKRILPRDYGGEEKSLEELQGLLDLKLAQYQDRFDKLDKLHVDEAKRPQKLENDEILGFHGNFKKLSVD
ncbi:uncharacterized protein LOC123009151 [Tribolium madens]|uniref:uncharacterized protein LOC123009151 n=1 Tax=Tribolium madens TaxID=41895 RepID=UPI001CF75EE2|nr:uncharacterized protein LOC123009151 [Tribolium madens]